MRRPIVAATAAAIACVAVAAADALLLGSIEVTSVFDTTRNSTGNSVYSNGSTKVTAGSGLAACCIAAFTNVVHASGKYAFRMTENACTTSGAQNCAVGLGTASALDNTYLGNGTASVGINDGGVMAINNVVVSTGGPTFAPGNTIDVEVDLDGKTISYSVNGGAFSAPVSIAGLAGFTLSPAVTMNAATDAFTYTGHVSFPGFSPWDSAPSPPGTTGVVNCSAGASTITVCGGSSGVSTKYMSVQSDRFNLYNSSLLQDLGVNANRLWDIAYYLEPTDPGPLTPAQIKANPNAIPWNLWDTAADSGPPRSGIDWGGLTFRQTITDSIGHGILPMPNIDWLNHSNRPSWMPRYPGSVGSTAYNQLWESCFGIAYWLNVRNNYGLDIYQISNEPDFEGWDQGQYFAFFDLCRDAITYVYSTFLPGRTPLLSAPVESADSGAGDWLDTMLASGRGSQLGFADFHSYTFQRPTWAAETANVQAAMANRGFGTMPKYISEWGYLNGIGPGNPWTTPSAVADMQNFLLIMSMPQVATHVDAWSFWELTNLFNPGDVWALVIDGTKTIGYYAVRNFARAMKGARPVYNSVSTNGNLTALTAFDAGAGVYHVFVQNSSSGAQTASIDLSQLITGNRSTTLWRYDSSNSDVSGAGPAVTSGATSLTVNGYGSVDLVVPQ